MPALTERLEVRLPRETMRQLRDEARQRNVPVSEVVREAIDYLLIHDRSARRQAADALFGVGAPVADWDEMEEEIDLGRMASGNGRA